MTYEQPLPPKNGKALTALILGIVGLIFSPVLVGGLLGIVALILGIIALKQQDRRGMAIVGIVTGALSIPMMLVGTLMLAILLPALGRARSVATEVRAATNVRQLSTGIFIYSAENGGRMPPNLAAIGKFVNDDPKVLLDPRMRTSPLPAGLPWAGHEADVDAHCDFYYSGAGLKDSGVSASECILFYDHPGLGRSRVVGFADGHVERIPAGSPMLDQLVDATNKMRAAAHLPPLPAQLSGPPPAVP